MYIYSYIHSVTSSGKGERRSSSAHGSSGPLHKHGYPERCWYTFTCMHTTLAHVRNSIPPGHVRGCHERCWDTFTCIHTTLAHVRNGIPSQREHCDHERCWFPLFVASMVPTILSHQTRDHLISWCLFIARFDAHVMTLQAAVKVIFLLILTLTLWL